MNTQRSNNLAGTVGGVSTPLAQSIVAGLKLRLPLMLVIAAAWNLSGCISAPAVPDEPNWAPVLPQSTQSPPPSNGAIYQAGYGMTLFEDRRARRVGDVLTVVLQESATAEATAETAIEKNTDTTIANPTILGQSFDSSSIPGLAALLGKVPLSGGDITSLATTLESDHQFDGSSETDQEHDLTGTITVTVHEVLPNGLLYVRGEKWVKLNQANEFIRVSGLVRPEDVGGDNSVVSTKLADARIEYSGSGNYANSNKPGWLARFFLSPLWLF